MKKNAAVRAMIGTGALVMGATLSDGSSVRAAMTMSGIDEDRAALISALDRMDADIVALYDHIIGIIKRRIGRRAAQPCDTNEEGASTDSGEA